MIVLMASLPASCFDCGVEHEHDQRTGQIQNASPTKAMNAPLRTSP
jgi:hypothetical protein